VPAARRRDFRRDAPILVEVDPSSRPSPERDRTTWRPRDLRLTPGGSDAVVGYFRPSVSSDILAVDPRRARHHGRRLPAVIAAVVLVLLLPVVAWWVVPPSPVGIALIDKTVPDARAEQHAAFAWWLAHRRIVPPGPAVRDPQHAWVGWHPNTAFGDTLRAEDLTGVRLAYLADAYGPGGATGYGGLLPDEVAALLDFRARGGAIVAEFNTLHVGLPPVVARAATTLLGARPDGWVGRSFDDLGDAGEVASWIRERWEGANDRRWRFRGPGLVLAGTADERIVVLDATKFARDGAVRLVIDRAEHPLLRGVADGRPYAGWFGGVVPEGDGQVLASFELQVTPEGRDALQAAGFPTRFPAIIARRTRPLTVAVTGEFAARSGDAPAGLRTRGVDAVQALIARAGGGGPADDLLWNVAGPFWDNVLRGVSR
jgi:hypothetical protein